MCIHQNIKVRRNVRRTAPAAPLQCGQRWRAEQAREEARRKRISLWRRIKEALCRCVFTR